jgi:hypothetical protein
MRYVFMLLMAIALNIILVNALAETNNSVARVNKPKLRVGKYDQTDLFSTAPLFEFFALQKATIHFVSSALRKDRDG